jgi:nucleoside-diphosphate-sugar epimerase
VHDLLHSGARVRALVRNPRSADDLVKRNADFTQSLDVVIGSLGEDYIDPGLIAGCDAIVHAAGTLRGSASTLVRYNVIVTRRLVRAAVRQRVKRFVHLSSLAVYTTAPLRAGDVLDEGCAIDTALDKRSPYVYSKIVQEQICWQAFRDDRLPLVVLRPGVIFGPGHTGLGDRIGPRVGRWLAVVGPFRRLPYTFVRNCAHAVTLAVMSPAAIEGDAFNLVDDELPTPREIVRRSRRAGTDMHVVAIPAACGPLLWRTFERAYRWFDGMLPPIMTKAVVDACYKPLRFSNAHAKERLGWRPTVPLATALDLTFEATQ